MYSFSDLIENLPSVRQSRMVASGFGLWMAWSGQLTRALGQTLEDHGGMQMAATSTQALWFFSTREVFKALARLQSWARLNPLPVSFQVLPASLLVGWSNERSMSVSAELSKQEALAPTSFSILVHPRCKDAAMAVAGLELKPVTILPGMAAAEWRGLESDPSYSYESSLAWYFVAKPLGNPGDRDYTQGWRQFFGRAEVVLRRMGLKFIFNESSLILPLENLRLLRGWTREMLNQVRAVKGQPDGHYWPCVMLAAPKEGLNFNEELPKKLSIEWNRLTPDYPHMSYRTAFLLGDEFTVNAVSYFDERQGLENWCYVSLSQAGEGEGGGGSLQVDLPRRILAGAEKECFYCGLKSHQPAQCPSRNIPMGRPDIWEKLAMLNLEDFTELSREVDEVLQKNPAGGVAELLEAKNRSGLLVQAIYENTLPFQLRMLRMVWRSRSKDWAGAFEGLGPEEGEYIWAALDALRSGNQANTESLLGNAILRYPRSYQPRSLQALLNLENEDYQQAAFFFQEAERLSYTPVQRAAFCMMQGRLWEYLFNFDKAIALYKQAEQHAKGWSDTLYRQCVCFVKMGFTEHAIGQLQGLIENDPHMFNRILVDPELERGRFSILASLWDLWREAQAEAQVAAKTAEELSARLDQWFAPDHPYMEAARTRVDRLLGLTRVTNYVAFQRLISGTRSFAKDLQETLDSEVRVVVKRVDVLLERLVEVQREASWFPFPKLLRDFNRDFNYCAEKLNWMKLQHLQVADNFRKAQGYLTEVEDRLHVLQGRLVTLRVIRDATFFVLLLGRNFIWMELVGLGLALILMPVIVYGTEHFMSGWVVDMLLRQKWQLQKGLIVILSIAAMAFAALKTAVVFERKKEQLFSEEYAKEVKFQRSKPGRLSRGAASRRGKGRSAGGKAGKTGKSRAK
ncbi:hypothetical protein dsx2_2668 [Desulfovibrio sp. X2]|uniref:tetratricopeptide repeat protein n=1 Tax=Desulfovibrio sp. X2 TaxID=941449 RepID=UPI0003588A85|nr:tetratricopeptide repeat protein [Desulfovibrio sp. X2]EPR42751.1 hypothetical protein dsx2_2668 [Desulfovibrio sp. X2]